MKLFWIDESGYVLVLSLIALPALLALGLIIVDVGRGNNAHSDLQAAADAVALAGGRELDGGADAIIRAEGAMAELFNTVSFLGLSEDTFNIGMTTDTGEFTITFLTDIPDSDDTPITATYLADNATTNGADAEFIHVSVRSQDLNAFFFNPVTRLRPSVPIAAEAVATYRTAACDVTPLYICNPFESETDNLQQAFREGRLYGRMLRLHPKGNETAAPGNFGFLSVTGKNDNSTASAAAIRDIFAGDYNPTCYDATNVTTKPGGATAISQGINVRFDMYDGPYQSRKAEYPPAANVRKGYIITGNGANAACSAVPVQEAMRPNGNQAGYVEPPPINWWSIGFTDNAVMQPPGSGALGATIGSGDWDVATYWSVNHPSSPLTATGDLVQTRSNIINSTMKSMATISPGSTVPSRYDVYRYEIESRANTGIDLVADPSQGGGSPVKRETGLAQCSISAGGTPVESLTRDVPDRRTVFAAVVNCIENADEGGGRNTYPVEAYASLFMVRPMVNDSGGVGTTIDVEVVDITGAGGNGTLDTFVRDEAILVR